MKSSSCGLLVKHLAETELDHAIKEAQKADEICLTRRLGFVKNLYQGDMRRWASTWNEGGIEGLRPRFGGGSG